MCVSGGGGGLFLKGGGSTPHAPPHPRGALEVKGSHRGLRNRLGRRLEEVAKAVGGGYCRLQIPFSLALAVRGTVAGHRLGALEGGGGGYPLCDIPSGCCFFTGPWTVTRSSLRMLRPGGGGGSQGGGGGGGGLPHHPPPSGAEP